MTTTATGHHDAAPVVESEKAGVDYVEKNSFAEEPIKPSALEKVDHTGAVAKTDPEEIALVRKIDWRLMVRLNHREFVWDASIDKC